MKYTTLFLFLCSFFALWAQDSTMSKVTIHVADRRYKTDIQKAYVSIRDTLANYTFVIQTDSNGLVSVKLPRHKFFHLFSYSEYDTISQEGYYDSEIMILVTDSSAKNILIENDPFQFHINYSFPAFYFQKHTMELSGEESIKSLEAFFDLLTKFPRLVIELRGYADCHLPERRAFQLSLQRAEHIKNWLVSKGISSGRFIVTGYGSLISDDDCCDKKRKCSDEEYFKYNKVVVRLISNKY